MAVVVLRVVVADELEFEALHVHFAHQDFAGLLPLGGGEGLSGWHADADVDGGLSDVRPQAAQSGGGAQEVARFGAAADVLGVRLVDVPGESGKAAAGDDLAFHSARAPARAARRADACARSSLRVSASVSSPPLLR